MTRMQIDDQVQEHEGSPATLSRHHAPSKKHFHAHAQTPTRELEPKLTIHTKTPSGNEEQNLGKHEKRKELLLNYLVVSYLILSSLIFGYVL